MEGDMFDTHVCLQCQISIVGLENYIKHKKFECLGKKPEPSSYEREVLSSTAHTSVIPSVPQVTSASYGEFSGANSISGIASNTYSRDTLPPITPAASYGEYAVVNNVTKSDSSGYRVESLSAVSHTDSMVTSYGQFSGINRATKCHSSTYSTEPLPHMPETNQAIAAYREYCGTHDESKNNTAAYRAEPLPHVPHTDTSVTSYGDYSGVPNEAKSGRTAYNREPLPPVSEVAPTRYGDYPGSSSMSKHEVQNPTDVYGSHVSNPTVNYEPLTPPPIRNVEPHVHYNSSITSTTTMYNTLTSHSLSNHTQELVGADMQLVSTGGSSVFGTPTRSGSSLGVDVSVAEAVASFVSSLSPTATSRLIDPNMVLYSQPKNVPTEEVIPESETNIADFLSSLELQSKDSLVAGNKLNKDGQNTMLSQTGSIMDTDRMIPDDLDHGSLRISSILNELNFSGSDSDGFDASDLLDFSDDEPEHPSPSHTGGKWRPSIGGKWKPGSKPGAYQKRRQIGGKWGPSESGGKWKPGDGPSDYQWHADHEDISDDEQTNADTMDDKGKDTDCTAQEQSEGKKKNSVVHSCSPCKRTFNSNYSYSSHLRTAYHKRHSEPDLCQKVEVTYNCPVCNKTFHQLHNFARHIISSFHDRFKPFEKVGNMFLDERYQRMLLKLMPYQCRVCSFYCKQDTYLMDHMNSGSHSTICSKLLGPLHCVRCKYMCRQNNEMLIHMASMEHNERVQKSGQPCVIKESRTQVECVKCTKICHSILELEGHIERYHNAARPPPVPRRKVKSPPVCTRCNKVCQTNYALVVHIRRKHTKERPHKCYICDKSFADRGALALHARSKKHLNVLCSMGHSTKGGSTASKQEYIDQTRRLRHARSSKIKCEHCPFVAKSFKDLRPHFMDKHSQKAYVCDICEKTFVHRREFLIHQQTKTHKLLKGMNETERQGVQFYQCKICNTVSQNKLKYKTHMSVHVITRTARGRDGLGGIPEEHKDLVRDIKVLPPKLPCPICNKSMRRHHLREHLRMHSNERIYKCILCDSSFRDISVTHRHVAGHYETKDNICPTCGKSFLRPHRLKRHMFTHGDMEAKFACKVCNKKFLFKYSLTAHMKVHTTKMIQCLHPNCSRRFRNACELRTHQRVHTGERPYLCDLCGYAGKTRNQLTRHNKTHTGEKKFQCEYCTYRSVNSTNLRRHMRIHIGSKPFQCPYCKYACNTSENLRKHIIKTRKHAGMFLYPCQLCEFGTHSSKLFKEHIASQHGVLEDDLQTVSEYCGWYKKQADVRDVSEGSVVLQPNIRRLSADANLEVKKKESTDHSYIKKATDIDSNILSGTDGALPPDTVQIEYIIPMSYKLE